MSLREMAENDLSFILEDRVGGFGWAIILTSPAGVSTPASGFSNDISAVIDPDTGQIVSGRSASVALRMSSLPALPVGISSTSSKPWLVTFNDIVGNAHTFKVIKSNPDRALGVVTCVLEAYT